MRSSVCWESLIGNRRAKVMGRFVQAGEGMIDIPVRTRIYVTSLVVLTTIVLAASYVRSGLSWTTNDARIGILLFTMIAAAERFRIDFPNRTFHFSVSVGAILSLGTAFTLDPLQS